MVKTYEESKKGDMDPEKFNTLKKILFRYISEAYKQFKWGADMNKSKYVCFYTADEHKLKEGIQLSIVIILNKGLLKITITNFGLKIIEQNFPFSENITPKDIAKLSQNIFKWLKKELEKI